MDKQMIEEMAKTMLANMERPKCFISATEEQDFLNAYYLAFIGYATHLYNAGYRKISENAVVLTEKEYGELYQRMFDEVRQANDLKVEQARKETAEKIAERLKFKLEKHTRKIMREDYQQGAYIYMVESSDIETCIDEICKEIIKGEIQ